MKSNVAAKDLENFLFYELVQEVIHKKNDVDFASTYTKLKVKDKEHFHKIILENKISSIFIKYINEKNCADSICKNFYKNCETQAKRFQLHSLQVVNEIREINNIFKSESLTPIYLKGIALQNEYEDISLRPMVDIDILFKEEELLKAYEILHKNNFLIPSQKKYLDKNNINHFCKHFHNIHIITKNNISLELHHRVTSPIDFVNCPISKSFFDDLRSIDHFNEKINIPSVENIIVHLLCHFSINSSFKRLLQALVDMKRISANHAINWKEILLKFDDVKIRKSISLSLELISLNKGTIESLERIKPLLEKYFPEEKLVHEAQHRLYDIRGEDFIDHLKKTKYLKTLPGILFPSKNMLKYRYKTPKSDLITYMKYYKEQASKLFFVFFAKKKKDTNIRHTNYLDNWLNKI